jgi:hypothetical protein
VDGSNNVMVTGFAAQHSSYPWGEWYATIKYSSAGEPLWTNRYSALGRAFALAVDGSNNVIVTGDSVDIGRYNTDHLTIKYSSAGVPLWTNRYNRLEDFMDGATGVAVDDSNNVIVTGYSSEGSRFDFVTVKYICVPEPAMTNLSVTNGTFQMRVDGVLQPGTLVIEASTNLAGGEAIFTNTTPTNVLFYIDPDAATYPWRFYRAFQFP